MTFKATAEELDSDVVDQFPVGVTIVDPTGEEVAVVYANERFLAMTGWDRSQLYEATWPVVTGPETRTESVDRLQRAVADGEPTTVELRAYRTDGDPFWDRIRVAPLDGDGESDRYLSFHEDVTDEKRRQGTLTALHEAAGRIQEESTVEAVCERTVGEAANVLDFELCSVLLRDGEWLVPRAISADAPPDGSRRMRVDQGVAGATYQTGESQLVTDVDADETSDPAKETYRSALSVPVGDRGVFQAVKTETDAFDEDDVELAELLVAHTASALERIDRERELERQNDRLESFVHVVSHDLRNPLNVCSGAVELARQTGEAEHFDRAERAVERMDELLGDLLALARHGEQVEEWATVDLARPVREGWETVATSDATLEVTADLTVRCHEGRLRELLENLFGNAVEHAAEDVTVTVGELADCDGFYVADDGPGIPADERETVFESGYSTAADGTGFGLSIVEEIASAHGWAVRVTDSAEGGARFEVAGVDVVS